MNKKRLLIISLVAILAVYGIIGTSLAYFTDTEVKTNVMTVGEFAVSQNEHQIKRDPETGDIVRDPDTGLPETEDFTQDKPVLPAVIPTEDPANPGQPVPTDPDTGLPEKDSTVDLTPDNPDDALIPIWDKNVNNEVDKMVTVTNDGDSAVYARTIYAFEDSADGSVFAKINCNWVDMDNVTVTGEKIKKDDGSIYTIVVYTYPDKVASKATTAPGLVQFYLDSTADTDWCDTIENNSGDRQYDIIVMSQVVQADGFADGADAMKAGFGDVTAENVAAWFNEMDDTVLPGNFSKLS